MAFHTCEVCHEDGTVVVKDVTISLELVESEGIVEWYGTLTVTHQASLTTDQTYRLTLEDGRTGEFRVRRNTFAGGENRAVAVRGTGPLK